MICIENATGRTCPRVRQFIGKNRLFRKCCPSIHRGFSVDFLKLQPVECRDSGPDEGQRAGTRRDASGFFPAGRCGSSEPGAGPQPVLRSRIEIGRTALGGNRRFAEYHRDNHYPLPVPKEGQCASFGFVLLDELHLFVGKPEAEDRCPVAIGYTSHRLRDYLVGGTGFEPVTPAV